MITLYQASIFKQLLIIVEWFLEGLALLKMNKLYKPSPPQQ